MASETYDVFVSYSRLDERHAAEIDSILRTKDLKPFFDRRNLAPGLPWVRALEQAIGAAKAAIVLIGPHGFGNTQQYERELAIIRQSRDRTFAVVPVILPETRTDRPSDFLQVLTWIDFSHVAKVSDAPRELERLLTAVRGGPVSGEVEQEAICPYRGLDAFREEDSAFFFGRGSADDPNSPIGELVLKVREQPFVMVVGRSGSGKSSLVFAGLLPALRRERDQFWNVLTLRPGPTPLRALASAFNPRSDEGSAEYETKITNEAAQLRAGAPDLLSHMIRRLLDQADGKPDRLLLYVDQWEELYAQAPSSGDKEHVTQHAADVRRFIDLLLDAARTAPVAVVATVRADFYDPLIGHPQIRALLPTRQVLLAAMSRSELETTIVEPAKKVGLTFDPPGLVLRILDEAGEDEGMLPLLQYALKESWALRKENTITAGAYARSGGVREAIRVTAERTFDALSPEDQHAARQLFLRLVTPGEGQEDTRARAAMPEDPSQRKMVEQFAGARTRLLVTGSDLAKRPTVEVAHEALIRTWPRLRTWVDANREKLRARAAVLQSKNEWEGHERIDDLLLPKGFQLERARALLTDPGDITIDDIRSYIALSSEREEKERKAREAALELEKRRLEEIAIVQAEKAAAQLRTARAQRISRLTLLGLLALVLIISYVGTREQRATQRREDFVLTGVATRAIQQGRVEMAMRAALTNLPTSIRFPWELGWQDPENRALEAKLASAAQASRFIIALETGSPVRSAEFSPDADGSRILTASDDGIARIWDSHSAMELVTLRGHSKDVTFATYSPHGDRVATASFDGTARIWDAQSGTELLQFKKHIDKLFSIRFSHDGSLILTASRDGTTRLWNAINGSQLRKFQGTSFAYAEFSPDGLQIVTASSETDDHAAHVWDAKTGNEILPPLTGHGNNIRTIAFSADGGQIITASWDHTARVWDAKTHTMLFELKGHSDAVRSAGFSPDGSRLFTVSRDGTARIWEREQTILQLNGHRDAVVSAAFSPDGKRLVTASEDGTARIWDVSDDRWLLRLKGSCPIVSGAFNPDRTRIATTCSANAVVWDATSGSRLFELTGHSDAIKSIVFSSDGARIATAGADKTARIWDAGSGRELLTIKHAAGVNSAAFSRDGRTLVTASDDGTAGIWDARSGVEMLRLAAHKEKVWSAVFSADGSSVLTASSDKTARLWSAKNGAELIGPLRHVDEVVSAAFSADGALIVTSSWDHTAQVWDAKTGNKLPVTLRQRYLLFGATFSPDGERIITISFDHTVRVWDSATGTELLTLGGHTDAVRSVDMSRDGSRILTTSLDGTALVWDARWLVTLRGSRLIAAICKEKLVGMARVFTSEDSEADPMLSAYLNLNVCVGRQ